jgi:hypothetical protein
LYAETGVSCGEINSLLEGKGYEPLFPEELERYRLYDAIVNNYPLNAGDLNTQTIRLEMISASG